MKTTPTILFALLFSISSLAQERYYSHPDALRKHYNDTSAANASAQLVDLWQDSTIYKMLPTGPAKVNWSAVGNHFNPNAPFFNDPQFYSGQIAINNNAYTVDTIFIKGKYRIPENTLTSDIVRLSIVRSSEIAIDTFGQISHPGYWANYGAPSGTTDTAIYLYQPYADNTNARIAGRTTAVQTVIDHQLTWSDTTLDYIAFPVVPPLTINNGEPIGVSFSFIYNGSFIPNVDSIGNQAGAKNSWRPLMFEEKINSAAKFHQNNKNQSSLMFSREPDSFYNAITVEAFNSPSYRLECLDVMYYVNCPTCPVIVGTNDFSKELNEIEVYPNPTKEKVKIFRKLASSEKINVFLYNMTGAVLGEASILAGAKSTELNLRNLPNGIYLCLIEGYGSKYYKKIIKN